MCLLCDWLRWLLIDLFSWLGSRCLLVGVRCCVVLAWRGLVMLIGLFLGLYVLWCGYCCMMCFCGVLFVLLVDFVVVFCGWF